MNCGDTVRELAVTADGVVDAVIVITENIGASDTSTATGDVYNTALYAVILMLAAIAGVTVLAVSKKRTDR